ncbi:MAG TPA: BON domain-containing protein [Terriglobales bacterium]|nr:BON domain-containing protein [Terriglobales bacterium]
MRLKSAGAVLTIALLLALAGLSGCSKPERTDAQVAGDVQTKISSDPQLAGKQIAINADKGVVTLSGALDSDAQVTSALNDAQQAPGVKQVISKLSVQTANAAPAPEEQPQQQEDERPTRRASSSRPSAAHRSRHSLPSSSSSYTNSQGTSTTTTANNSSDLNSTPTTANTYTPPPPPPPPQKVTVPAGTVLQVRTVEALSSETSHENDPWHGTLNSDIVVDDQTVIPAGAEVDGRVMEAHAATHYTGGASLVLGVEKISFNGKSYQIATNTWEKKAATRGKNTVEKTAGGAAVGAILGGIFGGGKGAAIGSVAGAGAGAGANTITKGQRVDLRPESLVSFQLQNPISVMPSASTDRHGTVIRPDNGSDQQ